MSRYERNLMMPTYEDDFGDTYRNVPVKIQQGAPQATTFYSSRTGTVCGGGLLFRPRRLIALFEDGRKLSYPVPTEFQVAGYAQSLKSNGAACIDYEGEQWSFIPGLNYRTAPYTGLPARKTYETGTINYDTNVQLVGFDAIRMPYRVPNNDNGALMACQKAGFDDAQDGGVCAVGGIIVPRAFIIKAEADDGGAVARRAVVSLPGSILGTRSSIANCAFCLGWEGESIRSLHNLV